MADPNALRRRRFPFAVLALTATLAPWHAPAQVAAAPRVRVKVFPGAQNLALFAAQQQGFFREQGLEVELAFTQNSTDQLRGRTLIVDAPNTAYALQARKILLKAGLKAGDFQVKPVGGTFQRVTAMREDKNHAASTLNPPFSLQAREAGLRSLGRVIDLIGPYQASGAFAMRAWAMANGATLERYVAAVVQPALGHGRRQPRRGHPDAGQAIEPEPRRGRPDPGAAGRAALRAHARCALGR